MEVCGPDGISQIKSGASFLQKGAPLTSAKGAPAADVYRDEAN